MADLGRGAAFGEGWVGGLHWPVALSFLKTLTFAGVLQTQVLQTQFDLFHLINRADSININPAHDRADPGGAALVSVHGHYSPWHFRHKCSLLN